MEKIRQRCEVKEIPIATWEVVAEKAARAAAKGPIQKPFPFLLAVTRRTLVAILMKRQEDESKARAARDRRARRTSDARVDELVRRAIFGATKPA